MTSSAGSNVVRLACSISEQSPAANGTTDDSAKFTAEAASCSQISLPANKQYFIGTNISLGSILNFGSTASTSTGALVIGTGITLTLTALPKAPLQQIFVLQGTGKVVFTGAASQDYPEWFGAKGDGSTDDTTAIQNAINAFNTGYLVGGGNVVLSPKTYVKSAALTITTHSIGMVCAVGASPRGCIINDTSSTADGVDISDGSASCCVMDARIIGIGFHKTVLPSTSGNNATAIFCNYCYGATIEHNEFWDYHQGIRFHGAATAQGGHIENNQFQIGGNTVTETSGSYYGVVEDSSDGVPTNSLYLGEFNAVNNISSGLTVYGFYASGTALNDIFTGDWNCANYVNYCVYLNQTGSAFSYSSQDIHLGRVIADTSVTTNVYISGLQSGSGTVDISGGWVNTNNASMTHCVDIENSYGVNLHDMQIVTYTSPGPSASCVYVNGGARNIVHHNTFLGFPNAILANNTSNFLADGNNISYAPRLA